MKHKLVQLISFIIFILGIIALVILVMAMSSKSIKPGVFLFGIGVTAIVLRVDIRWINKNFVEGEWIQKGRTSIERKRNTA